MSGPVTQDPSPRHVALTRLGRAAPCTFTYQPDTVARDEIIAQLDLLGLRKARLSGRLTPVERRDWALEATLGATAVQPCSVSLEPVTTRVDGPVTRLYTADFRAPTEAEAEMPEDDSQEPLPDRLDLASLLAEALALALPDFPRADGVDFAAQAAIPPGAAPITEAETNPFQALAALKPPTEDTP